MSKTSEKTLSIENTCRFWFKRVGNFLISENMHFLVIFRYLQISFAVKYFGVDQVLTKILQIDQKLTFNVFHILNQYRISKIEKNIWWHRPPPKKGLFWGCSVPSNIFFNFGDMILIQNMKNIKSKFRIDLEYFSQHLVNTNPVDLKEN